MKRQVFIIGLGLIGGSLALSIKKANYGASIVGFDLNDEQLKLAKLLGVIDEKVETLSQGAKDADLIIICAPVNATLSIIEELSLTPLKKGVIITDVGSTKEEIVRKSSCLREKGICFIGGHPMAGSHKSGVTAAKDILFENAFYLITPEEDEKEENIEVLKNWLKGTKAKFLTMSPSQHDHVTGIISHFPHLLAASLVNHTQKFEGEYSLLSRLAAGGFRDITRIASSSPEMWKDILQHNNSVLLELLEHWMSEMNIVKELVIQNDPVSIHHYFLNAKNYRDSLPVRQKGAIPAFYDLFVDVPDYPGVISEITGYLAQEHISITNIRILETREGIYGVLVISFQSEEDRMRAEHCISHYTSYATSAGL
ncbi:MULTISPECIES: prephenate dehydrogenase [unclassified Bacillus (in: firmicutes)]|uniref:prephenate dehydrogenase n=1 Tax=unclassified Bacillus (in: firmicutes) TaxID=185979 RepID=UPI0008E43AFA|nr:MULTISPECIES: prephenate dehydrogenase [unclassified Bacillus (in: firmicutes)]SFA98567.1 prephenate dehydrogenase [Bacillus sp. UNCCL13]SFQ81135.1 prephenate dehydrogenase [Bacillus sp. cl95]